jgi:fatty acid desaturase
MGRTIFFCFMREGQALFLKGFFCPFLELFFMSIVAALKRANVHFKKKRANVDPSLVTMIFAMTLVTMIFALLGFLSPSNRGGLMAATVLLWVFMGL